MLEAISKSIGRPTTPSELVVSASFLGSTADVDDDMKAVWHLHGVVGELRADAAEGALRVDEEKHRLTDERTSPDVNTFALMMTPWLYLVGNDGGAASEFLC